MCMEEIKRKIIILRKNCSETSQRRCYKKAHVKLVKNKKR